MLLFSFLCLLIFVTVHFSIHRLRFLEGVPRSVYLSAAGGTSIAYVFLHLLPELAEGHEAVATIVSFTQYPAFLIAMVGLVLFYGVERIAKDAASLETSDAVEDVEERESSASFWIHLSSFTLYNLLIGYLLLHRIDMGGANLFLYTLALGLHFVVTDYGLLNDYRRAYLQIGRWILMASVTLGWILGATVSFSELSIVFLTALLGGGVILNVLKEELPEERSSRFWAFVLGALIYTVLLVALETPHGGSEAESLNLFIRTLL